MLNVDIRPDGMRDDRNAVRTRILVEASSDDGAGAPIMLTVHDLSITGILFATDTPFGRHALITIDVAGIGAMQARILWSGGRFQGAEFVTPLARSMVAAIRERSKVVWPAFSGPVENPIGHRDQARLTTDPETSAPHTETSPRLAPATKIQVVVCSALLLWTGLAIGTWSLIA